MFPERPSDRQQIKIKRNRAATKGANAWGLSLDVLSFGYDVAAGPWGVANDIVFE